MDNVLSLHDLLDRSYPKDLSNIIFDSFNDVDTKLLVMLDGLDEFRYLNDIVGISEGTPTDHKLASIVHDLINLSLRLNTKVVLCGRPKASEDIRHKCFRQNKLFKLVEITAFDEENVYLFIDKYFAEDKDKAELVKKTLSEQENLMWMARIPIYEYILCNVFDSGALIEELDTTTKLNIASCLVFLRDHMRSLNNTNVALIYMCRDSVIIQTVRELSEFAYKSLLEQRIIFEDKDFSKSKHLSHIQDSGIFEKHEGGENGDIYQFKHLVLQEFLCAIHIINECIDMEVLTRHPRFSNSILIAIGLIGLLHDESTASNYMKEFAKAVVEFEEANLSKYDLSVTTIIKSFPVDTAEILLYAVHEYNCVLPKSLQGYFMNQSLTVVISFLHELQRLVYFLKNVKTKYISVEIKLNTMSISISSKEIILFAPYIVKINSLNLNYSQTLLANDLDCMAQCILDSQKQNENYLKILDISDCNLSDESFISLSKFMPCLEILRISGNRDITPKGFHEISTHICDSQKLNENYLKKLYLSDSDLSDESCIALSKAIPSLELLDLSRNSDITPTGYHEMSTLICENENYLKILDLSYCNVSDESLNSLSKVIPCLESLDLSGNKSITPNGFHEMSTHICNSQKQKQNENENHLKQLYLSCCDISDESCIALAKFIPCLELLNLCQNKDITPKGYHEMSTVICDALKRNNNNLKELHVGFCDLVDESVFELSKFMTYLKYIDLSGNGNIMERGFDAIINCIQDSKKRDERLLERMELGFCNLLERPNIQNALFNLEGVKILY